MANPSLLKTQVFWNKAYEVIVSIYDAAEKNLLGDLNYTVNVAMLPKFGISNISMREVIMTSIWQGFYQKNGFFWRVVFVQVPQFGTCTRCKLEILHQCE